MSFSKDNLKDKAVICLAAGKSQTPLIIKAKSLGYKVVTIDQNRKALGFRYADYKIYISTHDSKKIIIELKKLETRIEFIGILNRSSGIPVITAAELSKHFNIPGVPIKSAKILLNKNKMRQGCTKHNIPSPDYKIYSVNKFSYEINKFPIVIKPALSHVGKSGVSVVYKNNTINKAVKYAERHTLNNKILIEEYLEGPDLSLVSFVENSKLFPICLLEEINYENGDGSIFPKGYRTLKKDFFSLEKNAHKIAKKIISKFKIVRSPLMISFRRDTKNNLKIIEVHLDIGGDLLIETFFPKALSFDFLKLAVEISIGQVRLPKSLNVRPVAIFYRDGKVTEKGLKTITSKSNKSLDKKILNYNI